MLKIRQIQNKNEWENFLLGQPYTLMNQSAKYGNFYESLGEKSWVFGVYDDEILIGGSLVLSTHAKRGDFLFLPYGPVGDISIILKPLTDYLKTFARERNVGWRLDYFFISSTLLKYVEKSSILANINGSDHCPIELILK